MPLNIRSIAVSIAVTGFFGVAFIAWLSGLAPFTCCKRALPAALVAYIAAVLAVKAVNAILISAMVQKQIRKEEEQARGSKN